MHPIGKIKQGKQRRIIKFKTDTFEEVVYRKHKNRIKMTQQDQQQDNAHVGTRPNGVKFKPSLSKRRINLHENADIVVKDIETVKFVSANMHGNLKIMFNERVNQKFVYALNAKIELAEIIAKINHEDPSDMCSYDES